MEEPIRPRKARCKGSGSGLRREILDAARELFATQGYASVTLRRIARRIGYTPMAIYLHFQDKTEILDCICEETFTCFQADADDLDRVQQSPRERLAARLRAFIKFGLDNPHHYQLTFMTPPCGDETLARREKIGHSAYERFRSLVAACLEESGRPAPDAAALDVAVQAMWAAPHGLVSLLIARPSFPWADRERLIDEVVSGAIRALVDQGAE
jgi:AcrR family transcriptional regulator